MDLLTASLAQIGTAIRTKKVSAVETTQFFLDRIQKYKDLNAFITVNDRALDLARGWDDRVAKGEATDDHLLCGVPLGIKDMFCTKGIRTTAASKILENFIPPYSSTAVTRLEAAGAVSIGKTNMDEFAMGSSNETSYFGPVENPWKRGYVPGGSSGGSAAAVAARLVPGATGTDTGGSIRQPANFCSIVGLKPTYGRISRYGIIAFASSLDQAGPLVSTIEDAALMLEIMGGFDERDSTTSQKPNPKFYRDLKPQIKGLKVGLLKEAHRPNTLDPDVEKAQLTTIDFLKSEGAEIIEVSAPLAENAVPIYYLLATSEASSNLSRYDGIKYGFRKETSAHEKRSLDDLYSQTRSEGFGEEVKRRIMLGTFCLSSGYIDAFYKKACQVRRLLRDQYVEIFKKCDVMLTPMTPTPAFALKAKISDPVAMYFNDVFTVSTNLTGMPGLSVPVSFSKDGLPIGIQLTAGHFEEQKLLNAGLLIQKNFFPRIQVPHGF